MVNLGVLWETATTPSRVTFNFCPLAFQHKVEGILEKALSWLLSLLAKIMCGISFCANLEQGSPWQTYPWPSVEVWRARDWSCSVLVSLQEMYHLGGQNSSLVYVSFRPSVLSQRVEETLEKSPFGSKTPSDVRFRFLPFRHPAEGTFEKSVQVYLMDFHEVICQSGARIPFLSFRTFCLPKEQPSGFRENFEFKVYKAEGRRILNTLAEQRILYNFWFSIFMCWIVSGILFFVSN